MPEVDMNAEELKMSRLSLALPFLFGVSITGCAGGHAAMRGSVVMKIDPSMAHVCLGKGEVKVNDVVHLYKNVCTTSGKRSACSRELVGDGKVTEIIDDHYSVVAFPAGTSVEEGFTVEKAR